jgi:aspartyl-tRNA(Asn)/glutamyl-tRNA(Gln) amidotransferase subunit A
LQTLCAIGCRTAAEADEAEVAMPTDDVRAGLDRVDPELGMFIELDADTVLREAEAAGPGRLGGVTVAIKDLVDTEGIRTTYGSSIFADHVPDEDAPVVRGLREQGAIVFGKTNLNEFAYGVSGLNPHYGATLTPADRTRTAGGSSSGSAAAVSAGVCRLALGTDTSGSVRIPAACCGVYGLKLARGALPTDGIFPLAERYDSVGFFAAGVDDLALVTGLDELPDPSTLRIGRLGVDLEVPTFPAEAHWSLFREQVWEVHGERFEADPSAYGDDLEWKLRLPIGDVEAARREIESWRSWFLGCVEGHDVLVGPLLDGAAPTLAAAKADYERDEFLIGERVLRHTPVYNELGWVALAVPTADGPVQVAGPPGSEAGVLAVGRELGLPAGDTVVRA